MYCSKKRAAISCTSQKGFTEIPVELIFSVFKLLPKSDLKNCRLVNRKARDIASKALWHHIRIDLTETSTRRLSSVLHTKHYGLLANVKVLELQRWHDSGCTFEGQFSRDKYKCLQRTVTANLQQLLMALPKDALTSFHSDLGINGGNLTTLLATQTRLRSLTVRRARWECDQLPAVQQVIGNATMLRSLRIDLHCEKEYSSYCKLFSHMVALEELHIRGAGADTHRKPILLTVTPNEAPLLRLRHLDLFNLRINASAASGISTQIYLPRLQRFSIRQCWDGSLLLRTFAEAFSMSREQALEAVKYVSVETYTPSLSLMGLLDSVPRLIELESGNLFGMFPYTSSLMRHGDSLRLLCLHALGFSGTLGGSRLYHTLWQIEEIVKSCPNVEALGVTLVDMYWDFALLQNERVRLDSSKLDSSKQKSFTKSLEVIAQLPKLRTLRIESDGLLQCILPQNQRDSGVSARRYHELANEIMEFLVSHGSPVKALIFSGPVGSNLRVFDGRCDSLYAYSRANMRKDTRQEEIENTAYVTHMTEEDIIAIEPFHEYFVTGQR